MTMANQSQGMLQRSHHATDLTKEMYWCGDKRGRDRAREWSVMDGDLLKGTSVNLVTGDDSDAGAELLKAGWESTGVYHRWAQKRRLFKNQMQQWSFR